MSLVHSAMFNNHLGSTPTPTAQSSHIRSRSFELIQEAKVYRLNNCKRSYSDDLRSSSSYNNDSSSNDSANTTTTSNNCNKRARTAPPSPPYEVAKLNGSNYYTNTHPLVIKNLVKPSATKLRSKSLSPNRKFANPILSPSSSPIATTKSPITLTPDVPTTTTTTNSHSNNNNNNTTTSKSAHTGIKLPSISDALNNLAPIPSKTPIKLKPIIPTVSLDYFDTYKPNDENWRYGLLDKIAKESKHFHLNQYNYLNDHAKPSFDSKLSSKIQHPTLNGSSYKKINFPYESNYTYLNKTYMNDVKHYPEYLELAAESLLQLKERQLPPQAPVQHSPQQVHNQPLPEQQPHHQQQQQPEQQQAPQRQITPTAIVAPIQPLPIQPTSAPILPQLTPYTFLHNSNIPSSTPAFQHTQQSENQQTPPSSQQQQQQQQPIVSTHKFIPITPPSSSKKSRSDLLKSPPRSHSHHHHHHAPRVCISCGSDQSPCWRPSWSIKEGQLCNSCGLRYKKTKARCLNDKCKKIPAKGEWTLMQSKGKETFEDGIEGYSCIACGWRVEVLPK